MELTRFSRHNILNRGGVYYAKNKNPVSTGISRADDRVGSFWSNTGRTRERVIYNVPDYTRWDLRANWFSPSGTYTITGWVTNLLDVIAVQSYVQREGNGVTAPVTGTVTDERRIGITFNYQL